MGIVPDIEALSPLFLHACLLRFDLREWASEAQPPSMRKTVVEGQRIPLPPIEIQLTIVAEFEVEQSLVDNNSELIRRFEKKIQAAIARVWGDEDMSE